MRALYLLAALFLSPAPLWAGAGNIGDTIIDAKSPDGPFVNLPGSGVHTVNSSTIPLGPGGQFIGEFFDISQHSGGTISVITDADGTLIVDASVDGVETINSTNLNISSGISFFVAATPLTQFIRVNYTNGPVAQTKFFLTTMPKTVAINPRFQPLDQGLTDSTAVQVVRSVLAGRDVTDGIYKAVSLEGDRLRVVAPPPSPPPGTTVSSGTTSGPVSGIVDVFQLIPAGSTMTFQQITGGAEDSADGGKVIIFWDADGAGGGDGIELEVIYVNGMSNSFPMDDEFVGDGTAGVRLRAQNFSGGSADMFARFKGYTTP